MVSGKPQSRGPSRGAAAGCNGPSTRSVGDGGPLSSAGVHAGELSIRARTLANGEDRRCNAFHDARSPRPCNEAHPRLLRMRQNDKLEFKWPLPFHVLVLANKGHPRVVPYDEYRDYRPFCRKLAGVIPAGNTIPETSLNEFIEFACG